jgi:hypothetical protein
MPGQRGRPDAPANAAGQKPTQMDWECSVGVRWPILAMDLPTAYRRYTESVSVPEWCISLESATWLQSWCRAHNGKIGRACDLGSGLTSWVLRTELDCPIDSVDNSIEWLTKTNAWLEEQCVSTDGLMTWDAWLTWTYNYDLIVFDLGGGKRSEQLANVCDRLMPGGMILADDIHRPEYNLRVQAECVNRGWSFTHAVDPITRTVVPVDNYGRFAAMIGPAATY